MSFQWETTPTEAWQPMAEAYARRIRANVRAIAESFTDEIQGWMVENAVWTDRSGNARQLLRVEVGDVVTDMVDIYLRHGVKYGIYLELSNSGDYAIIGPAIDHFTPLIWAEIQAMLR